MPTPTRSRDIAAMPQPAIQAVEGLAKRWNAIERWNAGMSRLEAAVRALRIERPRRWRVIPAHEGSMTRLAGEHVTVRLSAEQADARRAAKQLADEDPAAYLQACRDGTL
jgi:hypothetical protein